MCVAGNERFELSDLLQSPVFKTGAIDHSANSPWSNKSIFFFGGGTRIRTGDQGFAGPCLTAWLCRHRFGARSRT